MIAYNLDRELWWFARSNNLIYTRYADDLTFSTSHELSSRSLINALSQDILKLIRACGYVENQAKRNVVSPGARKIVLGLLVDGDNPRLSKDMISRIDRLLYSSEKFGLAAVADFEGFSDTRTLCDHINGLTAWAAGLSDHRGDELRSRFKALVDSRPRRALDLHRRGDAV